MKMFSKYFVLLMIGLLLCTHGFAANDQAQSFDNYYVQPGCVYVSPDGIFVMFGGKLMQVDMLCADAHGVYVPGISMSRELVFCSFCRNWFTPDEINSHDCRGPSWQ